MADNNTYFLVFSWMPNQLGLKGTERDVFAIIYGFSQDGVNKFTGSLNYISSFLKVSRQSVINALASLVEKDYIIKEQSVINNVKCNSYKVNLEVVKKIDRVVKKFDKGSQKTLQGWSKNLTGGSQKTLPNNILDNIDDNILIRENARTQKKAYGEFQNVLLSDDEYDLLIEEFGNPKLLIKRLDEYKEQSGKNYNSDYMAIRKWVVEAVKEDEAKKPPIDETYNIDEINRKAMLNDDYDI